MGEAAPLPLSLGRYLLSPGDPIGVGHEAVVLPALDCTSRVRVALKVHSKRAKSKAAACSMRRDVQLLSELSGHPNLVRLFGFVETDEHYAVALERASCDLFTWTLNRNRLGETLGRDVALDVAAGLDHLHSHGVTHGDLKLDNVLVFEYPALRFALADFGFSGPLRGKNSDLGISDACGTPGYAAPELLWRTGRAGGSADVWALGVLIYSAVCGTMPFPTFEATKLGDFMPPRQMVSEEFTELMQFIFEPDKHRRPTLSDVREHAWFKRPQ